VLWPGLLLLGLWMVHSRTALALLTLVAAAASALAMSRLYHPGYDPTRVYEGTDARAFGLLIGAALAMIWPSRVSRAAHRPARAWPSSCAGPAGRRLGSRSAPRPIAACRRLGSRAAPRRIAAPRELGFG